MVDILVDVFERMKAGMHDAKVHITLGKIIVKAELRMILESSHLLQNRSIRYITIARQRI